MSLSIEQLTNPIDEDEALAQVIAIFDSLGFTASSWQEGSIPRTILEYLAKFRSDGSILINTIASGGLNELATDDSLTLLSDSHYDNQRSEGVRTIGDVTLTVASGSGPYSKGVGTVIVRDPVRNLRYRNVNALSLSDAAPTTDAFEAEVIGSASNDPGLDEVSQLVTALAGVTLTNAVDWVTTAGADAELDDELRTRNRTKWTTLASAGPKGVYINASLNADESLTRVTVDDTNAASAGAVAVYLADEDGGSTVTSAALTAATAANNEVAPLGATVTTAKASDLAITVNYSAVYDPTTFATAADAKTAIDESITAYFKTVPIGGQNGVFPLGGIYEAANAVSGIVNVLVTNPTTDTALTIGQVGTLTLDAGRSATPLT